MTKINMTLYVTLFDPLFGFRSGMISCHVGYDTYINANTARIPAARHRRLHDELRISVTNNTILQPLLRTTIK
jgi:hypothetical protein